MAEERVEVADPGLWVCHSACDIISTGGVGRIAVCCGIFDKTVASAPSIIRIYSAVLLSPPSLELIQ